MRLRTNAPRLANPCTSSFLKAAFLVGLLLWLTSDEIVAQDLHFSQYLYAPLITNPANTGDFNADWRFIHNFRSQWQSLDQGFRTLSLSFEKNHLLERNQLSWGGVILYDRSGLAQLQIMKLEISGAYQFNFYQQSIRVGIQTGLGTNQFSLAGTTTDSQWDNSTGYFNPTLNSLELNDGDAVFYPNLQLGVVYRFELMNRFDNRIGFSTFNWLEPNVGFYEKETLPFSWSAQYSLTFPVNSIYSLRPNMIYRNQNRASYAVFGVDAITLIQPNDLQILAWVSGLKFRTGFNRNFDAIIFHLGAQLFRSEIGLSYDITVSGMQMASRFRGAFEIYFVYYQHYKKSNPSSLPCFRQ